MEIKIDEPCHENWDAMSPTDKGRFCGVCKTEVVDFTEMNKQEIKDYFVNSKTQICVRIEDSNLINPDKKRSSRIKMKPIWVAAASMFVFSKVGITQGRAFVYPEKNKDKTQYNIESLNNNINSIQIEFQILDKETNKGIAFAEIHFLELDLLVKTDEKGICHVKTPIVREQLKIEINSLEHAIVISSHKNLKFIFSIKEEELTLIKRLEIDKNISFDNAIEKNKAIVDSIRISGYVLNKKTKKPIANTEIIAECDSLDIEYETTTDSLGYYELVLPKSKIHTYNLKVHRHTHKNKEISVSKNRKVIIKAIKKQIKYRTIGCPSF